MPGDEACDRSVTHACTSLERAAATFLAPSLMQWAPKSRPTSHCGDAEGIAGPIPGAPGNRDLVVVVGVAPVNLAGLKIGRSGPPLHTQPGECRLWLAIVRLGRSRIAGLTGAS